MPNSKTKWLISLTVIALLFTIVRGVSAQSSVMAALSMDRQDVTVGDVIPLMLQVTHPAGWRVIMPTLEKQWGEFEVRSQAAPSITVNGAGTETTSQTIEVARMRPGEVQTPELQLAVADDQGNLHNVEVAPLTLLVKSVLIAGDTQLRDLKPQAELLTSQRTFVPAIAVALLTLIVCGVYALRRGRRRPVVDKRSPRQRALDTLQALQARNPQAPQDLKAACVDIAFCLRDYIRATLKIPARDLTTNELARQLKANDVPAEWCTRVIEVLRVCDSVKFAGDVLELTTIHGLIAAVEALIEQYPPVVAQPSPGETNSLTSVLI